MYDSFFQALFSKEAITPSGLTVWNKSDPSVRFSVYKNNIISSLSIALSDSFPVTKQLVGEAFFFAMAHEFSTNNPPESAILAYYGQRFPDFIRHFSPAQSLPYLADVADLEYARILSYHATDAQVVSDSLLSQHLNNTESLFDLHFNLFPSVYVVSSSYAIVSIWQAHQNPEVEIEYTVDLHQSECALLIRPSLNVIMRVIDYATYAFINAIQNGCTLGDSVYAATAINPEFDLTQVFTKLLREKIISSIH